MNVELLGIEDLWTATDAVLVGVAIALLTGGFLALRAAGSRQVEEAGRRGRIAPAPAGPVAVSEGPHPARLVDADRSGEAVGSGDRPPRTADNIFISYRRGDSQGYARALYDLLSEQFGAARIFRDIDALQPGEDFIEAIERAISSSGSVIALIGDDWLSAKDEEGERRLENPLDYVRIELAAALREGLLCFPSWFRERRCREGRTCPTTCSLWPGGTLSS